jgi:hypothetical protein
VGRGRFRPRGSGDRQARRRGGRVEPELVASSRGLDESIDSNRGDTFLFQLEKSMTRLAANDTDATIDLMRRCRDTLETRYTDSDVKGWLLAGATDDTALDYKGADYEHVLTPALLALVDLLEGGQDAYAYALQVGEVQDRILNSTFGENVDGEGNGYNPRKATSVCRSARTWRASCASARATPARRSRPTSARATGAAAVPVVVDACERTTNGVYAAPHHGVVHVFRFAGAGRG